MTVEKNDVFLCIYHKIRRYIVNQLLILHQFILFLSLHMYEYLVDV